MSIFQDHLNAYDESWHSSPWKPYYNKLTSRTVSPSFLGDDNDITIWVAEEEMVNATCVVGVDGDEVGTDFLNAVQYEFPGGSVYQETDDVETGNISDSGVYKWWFAPGVALQTLSGLHPAYGYTEALTEYTYTIGASDIGERVYDGGIHCWMKLPHAPQDGGATDPIQTDIYSKNIPMEYIKDNDFLMVYNSFAHRPQKLSGLNMGLTIRFQYAATDQFVDDVEPIFEDVDISAGTDIDASSYMASAVITGAGRTKRANTKNMRLYWYTVAGGSVATFHGGQFIRVSLYPIQR